MWQAKCDHQRYWVETWLSVHTCNCKARVKRMKKSYRQGPATTYGARYTGSVSHTAGTRHIYHVSTSQFCVPLWYKRSRYATYYSVSTPLLPPPCPSTVCALLLHTRAIQPWPNICETTYKASQDCSVHTTLSTARTWHHAFRTALGKHASVWTICIATLHHVPAPSICKTCHFWRP